VGPAARADLVVLVHAAFVLFVALGGLLVLRFPRAAWLHLPALAWGLFVEASGRICPLTPLENRLRAAAGQPTFREGFVEHHVVPLLYPPGLSRGVQLALAAALVLGNLAVYAFVLHRRRRGT